MIFEVYRRGGQQPRFFVEAGDRDSARRRGQQVLGSNLTSDEQHAYDFGLDVHGPLDLDSFTSWVHYQDELREYHSSELPATGREIHEPPGGLTAWPDGPPPPQTWTVEGDTA